MIQIGAQLGPYQVIDTLGDGGMATLFLGRRGGAGGFTRPVAIKVVHERYADDERFVEMFFDEARLSAFIDHPNVIHVEALGEHEGQHYLVMEYLRGVTLSAILRSVVRGDSRITVEMAVSIASQIADGLHGAHETADDRGYPLNLIHRDVSPQNVVVTSTGHVKLIDFGVAKARGRLQNTEAGFVRGKIAYMSPEQLAGSDIDRRTDIFAAGVVLWEALTHRRLFRGRHDVETMDNVRNLPIPAPSSLREGLSPELDAVVLSALSRDPGGRPATGLHFRRALIEAVPQARFVEPEETAALVASAMSAEPASPWEPEGEETSPGGTAEDDTESQPESTGGRWSPKERPAVDLPWLARAEAEARAGDDPVALASAIGGHAVGLIYAGDLRGAAERLEDVERLVRTRAPGLRPSLVGWRAQLAAARGDFGARLIAYREAVELNERAGHPQKAAIAALNLADCYNQIGDHERAERDLVVAIAHMRQLGFQNTVGYGELNLALARGMLGRRTDALAGTELAESIGHISGDSRLRLFARVYRAKLLLHFGEAEPAAAVAEASVDEALRLEVPGVAIMGGVVAAGARLALGQTQQALALATHAHRAWEAEQGVEEGEAALFLILAAAHDANGEHEAGAEVRGRGRAQVLATASRIESAEIRERYLSVPARATLLK